MSKKAVRRVLAASALVGGLFVSQAASAAEDPNNPGLPDPLQYVCGRSPCTQYAGVATTGFASVERARQVVHVAGAGNAAMIGTQIYPNLAAMSATDTALMRELGLDDYTETYNKNPVTRYDNYVTVLSPDGAAHPYGEFPATTIRTVAFGSIPAQVTMHISQLRDEEDLPIPLIATTFSPSWGPRSPNPDGRRGNQVLDTKVTGELSVRLADLLVDGVRIDIGSECRTAQPATLDGLRGRGGYWNDGPGSLPDDEKPTLGTWRSTSYYVPPVGGLLSGTIDVPAFTGCGTDGDDLSPLLTAMASGPGNPLTIRQSGLGQCFPADSGLPCETEPLPLPKE